MNCKPYIRAHADELLESLAALVRIPSVEGVPEEHAPFGREPARALHETLALCEKLGFRTGNMDDRVGWCEYGEGEEMVAVLGHLAFETNISVVIGQLTQACFGTHVICQFLGKQRT